MAKAKDDFSQLGYMNVVESAANTLTFDGLSVFSNVMSQSAMIIHRVEYSFSAAEIALLVGTGDAYTFGIAGDDGLASISLNDPEVYDYNVLYQHAIGSAADFQIVSLPVMKDFSTQPGGGLLVPADRIYGYVQGISLASAGGVTIRFWFTLKELAAQDYLELAQAMRVLK